MKIIRLYTGSDQKSHFEEIEMKFGGDQPMLTTDSRPATSAVFRSAPVGLFLDRHPAPRRQYLVTLSGSWESKRVTARNEPSNPAMSCLPTTLAARGILLVSSAMSRISS